MKGPYDLVGQCQAQPCSLVCRKIGYVSSGKQHPSLLGFDDPGNRSHHGSLAGTVGSDQAQKFSLVDLE